MLRIISRYIVTGDGIQMLVGCQDGEDPIVKACRQESLMRKSSWIRATPVDRIIRDIHLYERVKTSDIPKETGRREYDFEYTDARNDWREGRI